MTLRLSLAALMASLPAMAFAAGGGSSTPPSPTETTTACPEGTVWVADTGKCTAIQESQLNDDALYDAARELAYAERYEDALIALAAMSDPADTRVLTYLGFVHRQMGDRAAAHEYYAAALAADPDNLLARSYLGMAYVQEARLDLAREELVQIRARGGWGTWPETALSTAIDTGQVIAY